MLEKLPPQKQHSNEEHRVILTHTVAEFEQWIYESPNHRFVSSPMNMIWEIESVYRPLTTRQMKWEYTIVSQIRDYYELGIRHVVAAYRLTPRTVLPYGLVPEKMVKFNLLSGRWEIDKPVFMKMVSYLLHIHRKQENRF